MTSFVELEMRAGELLPGDSFAGIGGLWFEVSGVDDVAHSDRLVNVRGGGRISQLDRNVRVQVRRPGVVAGRVEARFVEVGDVVRACGDDWRIVTGVSKGRGLIDLSDDVGMFARLAEHGTVERKAKAEVPDVGKDPFRKVSLEEWALALDVLETARNAAWEVDELYRRADVIEVVVDAVKARMDAIRRG